MCDRFFQPAVNPVNIITNIIRLIRDAVAIANDFLQLDILQRFIDLVNETLGDAQGHVMQPG